MPQAVQYTTALAWTDNSYSKPEPSQVELKLGLLGQDGTALAQLGVTASRSFHFQETDDTRRTSLPPTWSPTWISAFSA